MTKSPVHGLALDDIDPNTQVWSFCCMLWHLLSMGSVLLIRLMYIYCIKISKVSTVKKFKNVQYNIL